MVGGRVGPKTRECLPLPEHAGESSVSSFLDDSGSIRDNNGGVGLEVRE